MIKDPMNAVMQQNGMKTAQAALIMIIPQHLVLVFAYLRTF